MAQTIIKKEQVASTNKDGEKGHALSKHLQTPTIVLRTENLSFNIHSGLLKAKCPTLYARITKPNQQGQETITLSLHQNQDIIFALLDWIYTDNYSMSTCTEPDSTDDTATTSHSDNYDTTATSLPHHIRVYVFSTSPFSKTSHATTSAIY
ncbi:hypothetical protein ASPCADRAFT_8925 [Aspergillus carbonarius ITEM 5010]|uniref:BTB domain-containing protein n=1 Tax=Aspergillus carbonarius (strain ITEM 5010) TaxID=602072 RepID=A0A1R3RC42_ASPC5|nr:hypothetical protein ASPCADRAFT_8925 [Aspergillus carbonarius ITEM 5010]